MSVLDLSKKYLKMDVSEFSLADTKKLQELIKYHSDLYYNKEEPIISDFEYDDLFNKLQLLEEKFLINNKQTSLVWAEIWESTFQKVKHSRPMISLWNTYNEEDLSDFDERVKKNIPHSISPQGREVATKNIKLDSFSLGGKDAWKVDRGIDYTLEFKFDWLWVELIYDNGELVKAITRWNWVEGEDVTENAMQVANIPKTISYKNHLEVRGEVVMPISVFNDINEKAKKEGTKIFSNPRNSASWSLRMKDASITKERKLQFFAYDLANFEEFRKNPPVLSDIPLDKGEITEYYDVIKSLEKLGFDISSYFIKLNWIQEVINAINNFWNVKKTIDFEIDWLVLKVNDISLWQQIWFTEHHPRYAIAYKFPAEILTTKILSVEHSVWRTWTITPVANLEAINIGWVIVRRATLHNYEEVENLDVRIWDTVFIKRAWEVIPKIISVVKEWNRDNYEIINPPKFCPSCESEVLKDENKVRFYCPNDIDCPAKHHEKLAFAVGKQWFNIDWLWERQVEIFLEEWIIHNIVDIFNISEKREDILLLEWFKEKSVNNLIQWVEKAKKVEISTLLTALWIAWVGKKTAKTLSKLFESKNDLINFSKNIEIIESLEDVWPEIAKNVVNYFSSDSHIRILSELVDILDIKYYEIKIIDSNSIFSWKTMCITWSFEQDWKKISRDDLVKQLEEVWGNFIWSVSKNLDYLLAWEKAWSKLKKANELWVEVITLTYFKNNI